VEAKDWGFKGIGTLFWQGELDLVREERARGDKEHDADIDAAMEDGDVKMGLTVLRARDLTQKIDLQDVQLDLPPIAGNQLVFVAGAVPPAGFTIGLLKKEWVRGGIIEALDLAINKKTGKSLIDFLPVPSKALLPSIGQYEGERATFLYRPDEGLEMAKTYGALSGPDEARLKDFSVFAESYILPYPDDSSKEEWEVSAAEIAQFLVPSPKVKASGTLKFRRGEQVGDLLPLYIVGGVVEFMSEEGGKKALARWAARGTLLYDRKQNTVAEGKITGKFEAGERSTDHILFEERWTAAPAYTVLISGYKTRDAAEATRVIEPRALARIAPAGGGKPR